MSRISYPAVFHEDNNSYWVEFPDLEGCLTSGDTVELAFENAKEALDYILIRVGIYMKELLISHQVLKKSAYKIQDQ